jgi:hypothetical protein
MLRKRLKKMSSRRWQGGPYINEIQRLHTLLRKEPQSEFHKVMDFLDSIKIKEFKSLIERDPRPMRGGPI